jgi:hypothetical protein
MQRVLVVAIICLSAGDTLGVAQKNSPYQAFGDMRSVACVSWIPGPAYGEGYTREKWWQQAPQHAWVYGFIAGAGLMPPEAGTTRIDVRRVDAWMDDYCARHPDGTLGGALATVVKELNARR